MNVIAIMSLEKAILNKLMIILLNFNLQTGPFEKKKEKKQG